MLAAARQPMYEDGLLSCLSGDDCLHPGGSDLSLRLLDMLDLPGTAHILDLACGVCSTLKHLQHKRNYFSIGLDHSIQSLFSGLRSAPDLHLTCGSALNLPLPADSMDAILAECALTAVTHTPQILREISRVIKKSGRLGISDLYAREPAGLPYLRSLPLNSGLQAAFSMDEISNLLLAKGFEIIQWEDHSVAVKDLTSRFLNNGTSAGKFWSQAEPAADPMDILIACSKAKIGYFLLTAQKV
ncbi:MAG: DVU_1556 family methyltransferase [Chloroflexota bacterium]